MDKKLLEALQAALKIKGLNEGLSKFILVKSEDEIEGAITDFLAVAPTTGTPTLDVILKNPEVIKEIDRRNTAAVTTATANLAKRYGFDPAKEPTPVPVPPGQEVPEYVKEIMATLKETKTELEALKTGKTLETKQAEALALLKGSTVIPDALKETWGKRFILDSDKPFQDQLKELEGEFTTIEQTFKNSTSYEGRPGTGFSSDKATDAEIDAIV